MFINQKLILRWKWLPIKTFQIRSCFIQMNSNEFAIIRKFSNIEFVNNQNYWKCFMPFFLLSLLLLLLLLLQWSSWSTETNYFSSYLLSALGCNFQKIHHALKKKGGGFKFGLNIYFCMRRRFFIYFRWYEIGNYLFTVNYRIANEAVEMNDGPGKEVGVGWHTHTKKKESFTLVCR